ncbi:LysR family transcriptional regulator [Citricoccus nitrophenolicus]|uniref:LysR family transcriptional regulator n=1 Tax=Citricoccus nitrophenolicus TaxID=863575 RepID=UPI0031EC5B6F
MERREIEIFLTLAEELHFGRTAGRLLVSQARVSQSIAKLEHRFGVTLFDRTSRRVALTPVGAALYADVRAGFERIEHAVAVPRDHHLAEQATVSLADLDHETVFRAGRRAAPYRREPDCTAATLLELLALVAAGKGVCPLAAHATDYFARPSLVMVPFDADAPPVRWVLCWRRGHRTARVAALAAATR